MSADDFSEQWLAIEARLRAIEENYRVERIRKNGRPEPEGERLVQLQNDLKATCELYIDCDSPELRARMRDVFAWSYLLPRLLMPLIHIPEDLVTSERFHCALRLALAAASLENNKTDFRDTFLSLGQVWIAAHRRGLDPQPYFREAASWSSDEGGAGAPSMHRFFLDFRESAFFNADVAPKLESDA